MNVNNETIHQFSGINSIVKQATGRENVSNIDMNHVTVAQNKQWMNMDASGDMVAFGTLASAPMKVIAQIKAGQNLNGYDYPWIGGKGVNRYDIEASLAGKGLNTSQGTTTSNSDLRLSDFIPVKASTTYVISATDLHKRAEGSTAQNPNAPVRFCSYGADQVKVGSVGEAVYDGDFVNYTTNENAVYIRVQCGIGATDIQVEEGDLPSAYMPYENVCPITGFDSIAITVSPTPGEGGRVYGTDLPNPPGTVYGGTLTINKDGSAELTVDKAYFEVDENSTILGPSESDLTGKYCIARISLPGRYYSYRPESAFITSSYVWKMNGNTTDLRRTLLDGECGGQSTQTSVAFRDDRIGDDTLYPTLEDKKTAFKTLNAGLQIVYPLATPVSYQFTAEQISSIIGENYVWSSTGSVEVEVSVLQDTL